jgi:hypothetical protein
MRRTVLLAVALALVAAMGIWNHRQELGLEPRTSPVVGADRGAEERAREVSGSAGEREAVLERTEPAGSSQSPPLPDPSTPIAVVYDELAARARAGDARASCLLAQGLERCGRLPEWRRQAEFDESRFIAAERKRGAPKEQVDQMIDTGAQKRAGLEWLETYCAGLPPERPDETFDWMLRAADLGSVPAATRFASRPPISLGNLLGHLDRLETYRLRAPALAQRALAAGDPKILKPLARAYLSSEGDQLRSFLSQAITTDEVQGYALLRLAAVISEAEDGFEVEQLAQLRQRLSAAQVAEAEARATELRHGRFANATKPEPRSPNRMLESLTEEYCE